MSVGRLNLALMITWLSVLPLAGQERPRVEVPVGKETLVLVADSIETQADERLRAEGHVLVTYSDAVLEAPIILFDPAARKILVEGGFDLRRGTTWLKGSRAEIAVDTDTGVLFDAVGFTDSELFVKAETLTKVDDDTWVAESGYLTSCSDFVPKWSFSISKATIHVDKTARIRNTLFRVKKLPVFYFPYMIFPTGKRERSSGFMPPSIGNSNTKGRRISNQFYLVLGRSADIMLSQDYYSKRGLGGGFDFRARPNERTVFDLSGEFVDDRLGYGGASLSGVGHTRLDNGFRAAADFSVVSNFRFRQAFSDNFFTATRPTEYSRFFLTNNFRPGSFNLIFAREETVFPGRNVVIQTSPSIGFRVLSRKIPGTPIHVDIDAAAEGLGRSDRFIETPRLSQRLDLFPRFYASVHLFQGLKLTPQLGFRETFYSDSLTDIGDSRSVVGDSLHREYFNLTVDLKGWGLSRVYGADSGDRWKHLIEPVFRYRMIRGIDEFDRIVRFDENDAIADTNEVEYALINRWFLKRSQGSLVREWLSVKIGQKYFFDSSFGDAIREGSINQFFPLNSLTGLPYALGPRHYSPVTTAVQFNPTNAMRFDVSTDYDTEGGSFRGLAVSGYLRRGHFNISTTYFLSEDLLRGVGSANQIQSRFGFGEQDRGLSVIGVVSYDAQETRFLNYLTRASYFWDCCGISAEIRGFDLRTRDERQFRFSFFLKGIGSFGTISRPDSVF